MGIRTIWASARRVGIWWVVLMSGAFALVREFALAYMAAVGKPVAPNGVLAIFGHVALAVFIISGLVVLRSLHNENARLQLAPEYLKETPGQIVSSLRGLKWSQQPVIAKASYIGRWLRGSGTIGSIREASVSEDKGVLMLLITSGAYVHLDFDKSQRRLLENFAEGDAVEFEGKILRMDTGSLALGQPTIRAI